ncbi:tyrosine-type recombinase/integrase [Salmonella enterica]|nr:tyrosine-type recombinase/integrase [Salmonella enterica]
MTTLPREILQNSRSVVSVHNVPPAVPVGMDYTLAYALRQLAAATTGYPRYLLAPEVAVLLDAVADLRQRMLFDLIWNTGARINEALAVTPEDIVLDAARPFVVLHTLKQRQQPRPGRPRKNQPVKRAVPLLDEAFTVRLRDHLATFTRHRTKPVWGITDDTARNWMNIALDECQQHGIRFSIPGITPKTLRHSFAMHLAMHGALPATLQAYMGHRDFKSTQHYLRVFALDVGIGRNRGIQFTFPPDPAMLSMLAP